VIGVLAVGAACLTGLCGGLALARPAASSHQVRVFARIGAPGYPADALVASNGTVYAGTFHSLLALSSSGPSKVFAFSPKGALKRTYTIKGQTSGGDDDGVQVSITDHRGLLYLLNQSPAQVVTLNPVTGKQRVYATFASLPVCKTGQPPVGCSDGLGYQAPEPDFSAWGPDGSLYVTDYNQALIWRIPPGGGKATVFLTSKQLYGAIVGPAGLVLMPNHHTLMFDTGGDLFGGVDATDGRLYTVAIKSGYKPGPMTQIWQSSPVEAPDGLALARSGHIYVALVGPSGNAIQELSASGKQLSRIPGNLLLNQTQTIPFDAPGNVTFDGDDIIVGNQSSILMDTKDMALLEVNVGERGEPIYVPPHAGTEPPRKKH
jgi:outer membrane protein assembly factor BamB